MNKLYLPAISSTLQWSVKICFLIFILAGCSGESGESRSSKISPEPDVTLKTGDVSGRKILYVDSYHAEYPSSKVRHGTALEAFASAGLTVRSIYMDAKREKSDTKLKQAALKVKDIIESWKPDLLIAADDPVSEYLVVPYYKDVALPVVFTGVNWDASVYGYPFKNVTGQVEVELVADMLAELKKYGKGNRVGILTGNTLTDKKNIKYYQEVMGIVFQRTVLVNNFKEWQKAYLALQNEVDLLFVRNNAGIAGWSGEEAKELILSRTLIPTGTCSNHMYHYVLINFAKSYSEIGQYSAKTAIEILDGKLPGDIPISSNQEVNLYLNMPLAKKLDIIFPIELVNRATFIN